VLDSVTGETGPFSNLPAEDGNFAGGQMPRFYWITEGQKLLTIYTRTQGVPTGKPLDLYLSGVPRKFEDGTLGIDTYAIAAEI
jgi:hypothetical protein